MNGTEDHARLTAGLSTDDAYPFEVDRVEVVGTLLSTVFLAGPLAYKVKKPVREPYLDYTTLDLRRYFCGREVELNRRLAPDVYLGVVPVVRTSSGFRFEGEGEPVEYAVKMMRLPDDMMMDQLLKDGKVDAAQAREIASVVAGFHRRAGGGQAVDRNAEPGRLASQCNEDISELEAFTGRTISAAGLDYLKSFFSEWEQQHIHLLEKRVTEARIRDCHGDMHSRNICLPGRVVIFDCIEFNDDFRFIDVAREVAFLAMDLEQHCRPDLSRAFTGRYLEASGDTGLTGVAVFYKAWLAMIRGKVHSAALGDPMMHPRERTLNLLGARRYLEFARLYAGGQRAPLVLVLSGPTGSGKSVLARALCTRLGAHHLDSDYVRKSLAGMDPRKPAPSPPGEGIYSPEMTGRVYDSLAEAAAAMNAAGLAVIVEASFGLESQRARFLEQAFTRGFPVLMVYCTCSKKTLHQRLELRKKEDPGYSDGRAEILNWQIENFQPPDEIPGEMLLRLDTEAPLEELAGMVEGRARTCFETC